MKNFVLAVIMVLATVFGVSAQTSDEVRISAGATNVAYQTAFTGNVEIRKSLNETFEYDNTLALTTDGDNHLVSNQGMVRGFIGDNFFVGAGLTLGKATGSDTFLNPAVRAGVQFNVGKVNFEPYVQVDTPDLLSDNPARSLSGAVTAKLPVSNNFGILGNVGVRSTRLRNEDLFEGAVERFATGGVYFRF